MKRLLIIAVVVAIATISTNAQNRISIGIEGATLATGLINQNPYGFDKLPVDETKGNFQAVNIGYQLSNNISLQSGVQYLKIGQNYLNLVDENHFNNRTIKLNYVQIPFNIQNQFGEGAVKFISGAGFNYSRLVSSKFEQNIDTTLGEGTINMLRTNEVDSDRFNKNQLATNAFVGVQLQISDRIQVQAKALGNLGLTDINSKDYQYEDAWENPYKKTKNIAAGASLGLHFKL